MMTLLDNTEAPAQQFHRTGIIRRFGQWAVTTYGLETLRDADYWIPWRALSWTMWPSFMGDKVWLDHADFEQALAFGREYHVQPAQAEE